MSKDDFEYHAQAAGASSNMGEYGYPLLHVEPPFVIPADTSAVLSETACAFAADSDFIRARVPASILDIYCNR